MIKRKYGKSSKEILKLKKNYTKKNDYLVDQSKFEINLYRKQPLRKKCKNCNLNLNGNSYIKLNIKYILCKNCNHLNGQFKDTENFCNSIYNGARGKSFGKEIYSSLTRKNYNKRSNEVYYPKAKFLIDNLSKQNKNYKKLSYCDFGAGSGYFLSCLRKLGIQNVKGLEVSSSQVALGNKMNAKNIIKEIDLNDYLSLIKKLDCDVLSMLGVLEHLEKPHEFLKLLSKNKKIKYLYISVPTFSITSFLEIVFPKVLSRVLPGAGFGGHTHLYSEESLKWIEKKFKFKEVSSWWFGTDMVDLHRSITVMLKKTKNDKFINQWDKMFIPLIDKLQLEIDKKHNSSEVHILFKIHE